MSPTHTAIKTSSSTVALCSVDPCHPGLSSGSHAVQNANGTHAIASWRSQSALPQECARNFFKERTTHFVVLNVFIAPFFRLMFIARPLLNVTWDVETVKVARTPNDLDHLCHCLFQFNRQTRFPAHGRIRPDSQRGHRAAHRGYEKRD